MPTFIGGEKVERCNWEHWEPNTLWTSSPLYWANAALWVLGSEMINRRLFSSQQTALSVTPDRYQLMQFFNKSRSRKVPSTLLLI